MNLPQLKNPVHTLEDWKGWEGRWELIDGVAYNMTPSPNTEHQRISMDMSRELSTVLRKAKKKRGGSCEVFAAPIDVFLGSDVVQPDLVIVCDPAKITVRGIEGPPDLVVEILSPSTAGKDVTRKWWLYEAAGVAEYLIVDPAEKVGRLLRLQQGHYQDAAHVEWGQIVGLLGGRIEVPLGEPVA